MMMRLITSSLLSSSSSSDESMSSPPIIDSDDNSINTSDEDDMEFDDVDTDELVPVIAPGSEWDLRLNDYEMECRKFNENNVFKRVYSNCDTILYESSNEKQRNNQITHKHAREYFNGIGNHETNEEKLETFCYKANKIIQISSERIFTVMEYFCHMHVRALDVSIGLANPIVFQDTIIVESVNIDTPILQGIPPFNGETVNDFNRISVQLPQQSRSSPYEFQVIPLRLYFDEYEGPPVTTEMVEQSIQSAMIVNTYRHDNLIQTEIPMSSIAGCPFQCDELVDMVMNQTHGYQIGWGFDALHAYHKWIHHVFIQLSHQLVR